MPLTETDVVVMLSICLIGFLAMDAITRGSPIRRVRQRWAERRMRRATERWLRDRQGEQ
ncbi:hypothetical protein [Planobispora longispora]|uniref:Uncharacterized protein n=1 Tax=Planobispora longispora TaxID=28887 RepID=A0A8J3RLT5_9ACTN|nr:hypothetical protein [Planobispora longispora]BFE85799.1 hypothetical protein GCM10020093_084000 [Planobispora longispora]GIH76167.1 hypothetical protein Plo01_25960 [Planobispora longispora]